MQFLSVFLNITTFPISGKNANVSRTQGVRHEFVDFFDLL